MKPEVLLGLLAAAILSLLATATVALAHVSLETREAKVGAGYKAVFKIPHGCEGSATTAVRVAIPEGVIAIKPMPKPGWTIELQRAPYARAYKSFHGEVSEGVKQVTWRGGRLPDEFYDEFVLSTLVADALTAGTTIYFPVTQECEKGSLAWADIPQPGQDTHALKTPAPGLRLVENVSTAGTSAPQATAQPSGSITIEQPWSRATPGGVTVAAGYVKLTNTGKEPDRLIGATFERAKTVEIHMMTDDMGVMKMRQMTEGVALPPGVPVELKPGGMHLMLLGLTEGLKPGETVKGALRLEKAGTVDVVFTIAPLGAGAPSASPGHEHNH